MAELYHGARYYELPHLFPKAVPSQKENTSSYPLEHIRPSLYGTTYFNPERKVALAYPMFPRIADWGGKKPTQIYSTGLLITTNSHLITTRPLTKQEISLIKHPENNLYGKTLISDDPVPLSAITNVELVLYVNALNGTSFHTTYTTMKRVAERINSAYPNIFLAITPEELSPSEAIIIFEST
jgi:hypothetical protein